MPFNEKGTSRQRSGKGAIRKRLPLQKLCVTDRSKSILLRWFFLFYVLVFKFFGAVGALCMFFIFLVKLR